ncbi:MAG: flagellar basal body-associated FliL family protein [Ignavibacteriae bacterium]|nr:flagellar basal body-associated FliL family protein [Ignavibacteriota bacterium]
MAKQEAPAAPAAAEAKAAGGAISIKQLLMFGVPVFVVICGLMIWLLPKFIAPPAAGAPEKQAAGESSAHGEKSEGGEEGEGGAEPNIYIVKDVILNPAGTNGTRFLLTTVGFEVSTAEAKKEIEAKDVQVRDALNTILTAKSLTTLSMPENRDSIRQEITERVGKLLRTGKLSNVYFSKFIIQ